jgi:hypothetical protein
MEEEKVVLRRASYDSYMEIIRKYNLIMEKKPFIELTEKFTGAGIYNSYRENCIYIIDNDKKIDKLLKKHLVETQNERDKLITILKERNDKIDELEKKLATKKTWNPFK